MLASATTSSGFVLVPNWTVLVQMGIFVIVALALNHLVFKPILKILRKREEATKGTLAQAVRLETEAQLKLEEHKSSIAKALEEARALKEEAIRQGGLRKEKMITEVRQEINRGLVSARKQIETDVEAAKAKLTEEVGTLSKKITEKILERNI